MNTVPLKILYVDDDADIRAVAEMALSLDPGMSITATASGAEALRALQETGLKPDVILLDVMMPEIDGPTLSAEIRRIPEFEDVPIIFMTARARAADVKEYLDLGANGVIVKPFDPMLLAGEIRALLHR
jgi:two-component system, OmpR family, response regulator